ncbi:MAG: hypothetical protein OQL09_06215 [Gammaproteobacteria bacterium]|nr:hypothetical protein [Gammaproteobacteria bacterium]
MSPQIANTKLMDEEAAKQAASSTQSPQQVCEDASIAVSVAIKEDLHFYAPLHLEQAIDSLEQGQKKIKNKETESEGLKACFKVSNLVESGLDIKANVKLSLADALAELDVLKRIDEAKKYTGHIQDYSEDVIDLIKEIEAGKINEAMQGQAKLLKDMLGLEIKIVSEKNLAPVKAMLEKAEDAEADELAKITFKKAEQELQRAEKIIRANYRNEELVKNASAQALREARHAFYVAEEVKTLKELKPKATEEKILYIESLLERVNQKFNNQPVTGHSLYEQSTIISQRLEALIESKESLAREIQLLKQQQNQAVETDLPTEPVLEPAVNDTEVTK